MYTKEELESMKFKQLKSIAQEKKISRRLTTKREIIDSLLNFDQAENLDDITVTLINSSNIEESPPAMKSIIEVNPESGIKNKPENVGKARSVRRRFPKPRMTVFQMYDAEDQSLATHTNQSSKGNVKYFDEPGSKKMSKVDEGLNTSSESSDTSAAYSTKKNKSEVQNSNKKQTRSSTRNFTPRLSVNLDIMVVDPSSTNIRITRRTRNTNAGKEISETVASEPQIAEIEHIKLATIGRKRQARYFKHSLSNMMEGVISTEEVTTEAENVKYFDEPGSKKMSKVDEDLNISSESSVTSDAYSAKKTKSQLLDNYGEIQNSNKKQTRSSTRNFTPRQSDNLDNGIVNLPSTSIRITRRTRNKNAGKERSETVASEPQIAEIEHINLATIGGKRQSSYLKNSINNIMEDVISTEEVTTEADAQDMDPQLNETFEIEEQHSKIANILSVYKSDHKNKMFPTELRRSVRRRTMISSPEANMKVFTPKDIQEESPKLNETFEIEEKSDDTLDSHKFEEKCEISSSEIKSSRRSRAILSTPLYCNKISLQKENEEIATANSNVKTSVIKTNEPVNKNKASFTVLENKGTGNKRRSSSCPHKTSTKNDYKLQFLSPSSKSVTKSKDSQKKGRPTPMRNTRIPKFIKKVPDFQNIHKKQFEKMESLVDNHQRKLERAKDLLTPAMSKDGVIVFTAQPTIKQTPLRKPVTQNHGLRIQTKLNDRYDAHFVLRELSAPVPAQNARSNIYNKQNVKELITRKLPIHDRRENVRQESRTTIRGVRLNRRFELQMAHRKID